MAAFVLRRLASTVLVMAIVGVLIFLLLHLSPGDPAAIIAGDNATPEQIAAIRKNLGLDEPLVVQFGRWAGHVLSGDLGISIFSNVPVVTLGNPERLWLRVFVGAPKIGRVQRGDPALVRVTGVRQEFHGRVVEIASKAEFTPRAALTEEERANLVFGVKIEVESSDGTLKPGLPADARIQTGPADARRGSPAP